MKTFFDNEKVNDAGGLLREWIYLLTIDIFSEKIGIFVFFSLVFK